MDIILKWHEDQNTNITIKIDVTRHMFALITQNGLTSIFELYYAIHKKTFENLVLYEIFE